LLKFRILTNFKTDCYDEFSNDIRSDHYLTALVAQSPSSVEKSSIVEYRDSRHTCQFVYFGPYVFATEYNYAVFEYTDIRLNDKLIKN